ncbi:MULTISPECIES: poly-gamma-glutamate hydrolase family protein [Natrialbaceae]|uniref:poly-gamma-glutamate hydrolase family protein n=1 Tax=Natrialbaceae TaxID=1644061 RepID=UPI00207C8BC7|nr:poly-gamma-glutamate hydrolase family protein [Natronococcus sp. CG52]
MARSTITTRPLEVTETGHLTELLYDDGSSDEVLICAAHGGRVEPGTAEQALELATRLPAASCWTRLGYADEGDAFDLWHPPSSAIDPESYPLLEEIADRGFETVISLHGLADDRVLVGGGIDDDTKRAVASRLETAVTLSVETVSDGPYAGASPNNFVNWLAADGGGLQLEQGLTVREREADAVASTLETALAEEIL